VAIDLGTGDGRYVLATAAQEPCTLAVGIDADSSRMAEASRRAARAPKKGGLPNALFVVAGAESLPSELDGVAGAVTIHFPWGSLLRGVLGAEPWLAAALARVTSRGAAVEAFVSVTPRDALAGPEEIAATHSSWARRLGAGRARPVWRLRLRVPATRC
jgi:16S rRNA (adenine(1408)-N(1))-methyltransferase